VGLRFHIIYYTCNQMEHLERIEICANCRHRGFDRQLGTICGITGEIPDFEETCNDYLMDQSALGSIVHSIVEEPDGIASWSARLTNTIIDSAIICVAILIYGIEDELTGLLIVPIYYLFLESLAGKTIGKMFTKTRVVTVNGDKPDFVNILGRTLCRFIPFEALSFMNSTGVGWHDVFSGTRVVNESMIAKISSTDIIDDIPVEEEDDE
jgi:hypothetical protein